MSGKYIEREEEATKVQVKCQKKQTKRPKKCSILHARKLFIGPRVYCFPYSLWISAMGEKMDGVLLMCMDMQRGQYFWLGQPWDGNRSPVQSQFCIASRAKNLQVGGAQNFQINLLKSMFTVPMNCARYTKRAVYSLDAVSFHVISYWISGIVPPPIVITKGE